MMPAIQRISVRDAVAPKTLVRVWEANTERFPERTAAEWLRHCRQDKGGVIQIYQKQNKILDAGQTTLAALLTGDNAAWQNGRWYRQALGTNNTTPVGANTSLNKEIFRKVFTECIRSGRTVVANTFFTGLDYANASSTVTAAGPPTTTTFTLASGTNFNQGDRVRVFIPTGYEFREILTNVAGFITLTTALSVPPTAGATVDQVTAEAGIFGDIPAQYAAGTIGITTGSTALNGTGTGWVGNVVPGDQVLIGAPTPSNRQWYTVLLVNSNTSITLTAPYTGGTIASGGAYIFRGTGYNRVNNLDYVKTALRGVVVENQWLVGG